MNYLGMLRLTCGWSCATSELGKVEAMVVAFVSGGPAEVFKLTSRLQMGLLHGGGCQSLFYVRSESHQWKTNTVSHYRFEYLENFKLDVEFNSATQLKAAVNPHVVDWSNVLIEPHEHQSEQQFIQRWFEVMFTLVLLIGHHKQLTAGKLRDKLCEVQRQWRVYEASDGSTTDFQPLPLYRLTTFSTSHEENQPTRGSLVTQT